MNNKSNVSNSALKTIVGQLKSWTTSKTDNLNTTLSDKIDAIINDTESSASTSTYSANKIELLISNVETKIEDNTNADVGEIYYAPEDTNKTNALGEIFNDYDNNIALGINSHAEGSNTTAIGDNSHASGLGTIASADNQTVIGKYNKENENALFIIGNGTNADNTRNAFEVVSTTEGDTTTVQILVDGEDIISKISDAVDITADELRIIFDADTSNTLIASEVTYDDITGELKTDSISLGLVAVDGQTITIDENGIISTIQTIDPDDIAEILGTDVVSSTEYQDTITTIQSDITTLKNDVTNLSNPTYDTELNATSENAVQNKVLYSIINDIQTKLNNLINNT